MKVLSKVFLIVLLISCVSRAQGIAISKFPAWGLKPPGQNFMFPMVDTIAHVTKRISYRALMNTNAPDTHTVYYAIPVWKKLSSAWKDSLSLGTQIIDNTLHSLIVYTDTAQLIIVDTVLKISNYSNGTHSFSNTATVDSVYIGATFTAGDNIFLQPISNAYNVNDILFVEKHAAYIKVHRNTGGTNGLQYSWYWIKRY